MLFRYLKVIACQYKVYNRIPRFLSHLRHRLSPQREKQEHRHHIIAFIYAGQYNPYNLGKSPLSWLCVLQNCSSLYNSQIGPQIQ